MRDDQRHLVVTIRNQPLPGNSVRAVVDRAIYPDEQTLRLWLEDRYGRGGLSETHDGEYVYTRRVAGPAGLWRILTMALNRSYN